MLKRIVQYSIIIVLSGLLVWGVLWARGKAGGEMCTSVVVDIPNADSITFVTRAGILNELKSKNIHLIGERMGVINTDKVEAALRDSEYLENVDCYKSQHGKVVIKATQLVPVLRVFDGGSSYYVNARGKRMSATATYHADVPIVKGHFSEKYPPSRILPMVTYVNEDPLLSSLVSMYCMVDSNNIYVVPTIKGHVVNVGRADGYANKFEKLLLFYRKVMPVKGWLTYDTLSVKWAHQIVATRRVRPIAADEAYDASLDEPEVDMQTMSVSDTKQTLAVKKDEEDGKKVADDAKKPAEEKAAEKKSAADKEKKADKEKAAQKKTDADKKATSEKVSKKSAADKKPESEKSSTKSKSTSKDKSKDKSATATKKTKDKAKKG